MFLLRVAIAKILLLSFTITNAVHVIQLDFQQNQYLIYPLQMQMHQTDYQANITLLSNNKNQLVFY